MRLYPRIYLHSLGVLLVATLVTAVTLAVGARGAGLREIAERVGRHAASLAAEHWEDRPRLEQRIRQLHADLDLDVTVRDLGGGLVASAGAPRPPLAAAEAEAVRGGRAVVHPRPRWLAVAPVREPGSGRVVGTVQIAARRRAHGPALLWPLVTVGAVLLAVAVASGPLARRIARPLERLAEASRRLGRGDLTARAPEPTPGSARSRRRRTGEIHELTRSFNEMAERIERLVGGQKALLANVSHELRSPLARVRVALELLPRAGDVDARLSAIEADLVELDRLIDDVLTGARLDATGLGARVGTVDVGALLADLAERARHDPATAGTAVHVVPAAAHVVGDAGLLRRALWNLLENAARYGAPPIALASEAGSDGVRLSVTDAGPGIAPAERDRVLDPFYRGDPARTPGGPVRGFGLGLTLARQIAIAHGGTLTVGPATTESGQEQGCRVVMHLPPPDRFAARP